MCFFPEVSYLCYVPETLQEKMVNLPWSPKYDAKHWAHVYEKSRFETPILPELPPLNHVHTKPILPKSYGLNPAVQCNMSLTRL